MEKSYSSFFKSLLITNLGLLRVDICWLHYAVTLGQIFQILGISCNLGLYPEHFKYFVLKL